VFIRGSSAEIPVAGLADSMLISNLNAGDPGDCKNTGWSAVKGPYSVVTAGVVE
jgi:hypothetical protein